MGDSSHIELAPDGENLVYETPWLDFYYDDIVHADGTPGKYSWFKRHNDRGAMMMIPVTPLGRFLVIKIWRHPIKRYFWEFPAGLAEDGESSEDTARRELLEETGVTVDRVETIGSVVTVSGLDGGASDVVLAEIPEVSPDDLNLQSSEGIGEARLLTLSELFELLASQEINDGVTMNCLAHYWMWSNRQKSIAGGE